MQEGPSGTAIVALVLGILSFLGGGCVTGLPAWLIGRAELDRIRTGQAPIAGRGIAQAGMILGIITTVVTGLAILAGIALLALGFGLTLHQVGHP